MPCDCHPGLFNRSTLSVDAEEWSRIMIPPSSFESQIESAKKIQEQSRKHAERVLQIGLGSKIEEDRNNAWRTKLFLNAADKISFVKSGDDIPINGCNSRWINVYYDFKYIGRIFAYSNLEREIVEVTIYFL